MKRTAGFSLLEILVVVAIIAVMAALSVPATSQFLSNQRLMTAAQNVSASLAHARGKAIKTGNVYLAFFGTDATGALMSDSEGDWTPILVLDDGRPGDTNQNCVIDSGEEIMTLSVDDVVQMGVTKATAKVPVDAGTGAFATGSTFTAPPFGGAARWVMFRPDGTPVRFNSSCATGNVGSGGGGIYLTNGNRDVAVVITPLGAARVYAWNDATSSWSD